MSATPLLQHRLHRCESCGCQVTDTHIPDSPRCRQAREERRWSIGHDE